MATDNAPAGWLEDYSQVGTTRKDIGILLIHGFTGSPASMRPWAHYLSEKGYTVRVPQLPGHGAKWQDLNTVSWESWPAKAEKELATLKSTCKKVFICGLSMGGGTTLNIASKNEVDGIILANPMIHIPGVLIKFAPLIAMVQPGRASVGDDIKKPGVTEWGYDVLPTKGVLQLNKLLKATRAALKNVKAPLLLFHSTEDHVLPLSNTEIIMSEVGSPEKKRLELSNSYHVSTMDYDAPEIFAQSLAFIEAHSS
jgi:carboxylesterase